jgi:hypothetical protein
MNSDSLKNQILQNAEHLRQLHQRIHSTLRYRSRSPEDRERWSAACAEFHRRYDALAFPGGESDALDRIAEGDSRAIEAGICFVECRPFFFRSGYMFKDILRKLKRANLTAEQSQRLGAVVDAYDKYRAARQANPPSE